MGFSFFIKIQCDFFTVYDLCNPEKRIYFFITVFLDKKNLAGARFKEGVNNKINLYHLWYIATTLSPKKVTSMKQQPYTSTEQN